MSVVPVVVAYPISLLTNYRFVNLIILAIMSVVCGIADSILEQRAYPEGAPWLVGDNQSGDNPKINGLITAIFALITYVFLS